MPGTDTIHNLDAMVSLHNEREALGLLFDKNFYLQSNPDVASSGTDAFEHFKFNGSWEGRSPRLDIELSSFIEASSLVRMSALNPFFLYMIVHSEHLDLWMSWQDIEESWGSVGPTEEAHIRQALAARFDADFYCKRYSDIAESALDPFDHFMTYGAREGRDPCEGVDLEKFIATNLLVPRSALNPFFLYLVSQIGEAAPSCPPTDAPPNDSSHIRDVIRPHFDAEFYRRTYPDVVLSGAEPLDHFMAHGAREGRRPSDDVDLAGFIKDHPLVGASSINPFFLYLITSPAQTPTASRVADADPVTEEQRHAIEIVTAHFDRDFYNQANPDILESRVDALQHFLGTGWKEKRDPNKWFSVANYLDANPDVVDINPFYHYLIAGKKEGRVLRRPLSAERELILKAKSESARASGVKASSRAATPLDAVPMAAALDILIPKHRSSFLVSLSHDEYTRHIGGIQNCVGDEQRNVTAQGVTHIHVAPALPSTQLKVPSDVDEVVVVTVDGERVGQIAARDLLAYLGRIPPRITRDLIVHSFLGFSVGFVTAVQDILTPHRTALWIHDCSTMCTSYTLLRNDVEFCWSPAPSSNACSMCVYGAERRAHLSAVHEIFSSLNPLLFFPSESMKRFWLSRNSLPHQGAYCISHASVDYDGNGTRDIFIPNRHMKVAFVGAAVPHKGWHVFCELAESHVDDHRYEFLHFATHEDPQQNIRFVQATVSKQHRDAMIVALIDEDVDVVVNWSLCFETFSFSTMESIAAGCFVVARANSGNAAAFIEDTGSGCVVDSKSDLNALFTTDDLVNQLMSLRSQSTRIGRLSFSSGGPFQFLMPEAS